LLHRERILATTASEVEDMSFRWQPRQERHEA
jgi:hypothetical protein